MMRIQKILSSAGIASRRKSEDIIAAGRVTVNGSVASIGQSADPDKDKVCVDGVPVSFGKKVYVAVYKPYGYVSTVSDRFAEKKVVDLVQSKERLFPVGRLDSDSEGLILLTNDGDFANRVMHPRYNVEKTYVVRLEKPLNGSAVGMIESGLLIDGKKVKAKIRVLDRDCLNAELTIHEGMHKIVKRMFKSVGNYVLGLRRTGIGGLSLGSLKPGEFRHLTKGEIDGLCRGY